MVPAVVESCELGCDPRERRGRILAFDDEACRVYESSKLKFLVEADAPLGVLLARGRRHVHFNVADWQLEELFEVTLMRAVGRLLLVGFR